MEALDCRPSFLKVFLPNLCSEYLRIPPAFRKYMQSNFSRIVSLEGPSGNKWEVELVESSDELRFENGWKKFILDHIIEKGDMLEFSLEEPLYFCVRIFDMTACEKESTFMVSPFPRGNGVGTDLDNGEEADMVGEPHIQESPSIRVPKAKLKRNLGGMASSAIQGSSVENSSNSCAGSQTLKRSKIGPTAVHLPQIRVTSQRRLVTDEEVRICLQRAEAFKTHNPSFCRIMRHSSAYSHLYLSIPLQFWKSHLSSNVSGQIWLFDPRGRGWQVTCVTASSRSGFGPHSWGPFSISNNLEKHDVCVFELIAENNFKVHIFRVVEQITPLLRLLPRRRGAPLKQQIG